MEWVAPRERGAGRVRHLGARGVKVVKEPGMDVVFQTT
jgi:hypothetical protein